MYRLARAVLPAPKESKDDEEPVDWLRWGGGWLCEMSDDDWVDAHECYNNDIQSILSPPTRISSKSHSRSRTTPCIAASL